jgi:flagellar motor switch protein FliN
MADETPSNHLDLFKDLTIEIQGVLGRIEKPLSGALQLGIGSVLEFDRYVEEPVDVVANGKLVAKAVIVAVNGCYGLKLKEIINT